MKKVIAILFAILSITAISAIEIDQSDLTVVFNIDPTIDNREIGFSQIEVRDVEDTVIPFAGNVVTFNSAREVEDSIDSEKTVFVYWKVLSGNDFELTLSGEPLTTVNANVSPANSDITTINYGATWTPVGYEETASSSIGFGSDSNEIPNYESDRVLRHNPSMTNLMNNYGSIELNLKTEDAQGKVPGVYSATMTLGVRTLE